MGILAATIANAMAPRKGKPYRPADFMPDYSGSRAPQDSDAKMRAFLDGMVKKGAARG